jgi:hypothetical protein
MHILVVRESVYHQPILLRRSIAHVAITASTLVDLSQEAYDRCDHARGLIISRRRDQSSE